MLGPQLLASQTCGFFRLYDAARGEVHGSPKRCFALYFLWLKSKFHRSERRRSGKKLPLPGYGSLPQNVRMLSCLSGACYQ